ncbi:hypothetical protein SAMN03159382_04128 [Pseudomonas sp. NFACC23-1]|nr:hypothetical protein SAMN03159386_04104 [Pseudomonas sp. NFACC17-2]SEJ74455.1 hypothetical protein SAMN03159382_04128 [Pseudomonas sp. NFACC23-1]SFW86224.1 hypothetical protein SAMN05660640_04489 [Pseudomonas sp. NFACC16-2]
MFTSTSTAQDVHHIFAFKNTAVEIALIITQETVARLEFTQTVIHSRLGIQNTWLKALRFDLLLLGRWEHDIQQHPLPHDAKRPPVKCFM